MKQVDLKNILETQANLPEIFYTYEMEEEILRIMREACNQTVDLCAENARTRHDYYDKWDENTAYNDHKDEGFERCDGDGMPYGVDVVTINKQSILDTKNQIV